MKKILAVLAMVVFLVAAFLVAVSPASAQSDLLTNTNYANAGWHAMTNRVGFGPMTNVLANTMAFTINGTNVSVVTNVVVQRDLGTYVYTNSYLP